MTDIIILTNSGKCKTVDELLPDISIRLLNFLRSRKISLFTDDIMIKLSHDPYFSNRMRKELSELLS